jgi:hypothetical protein
VVFVSTISLSAAQIVRSGLLRGEQMIVIIAA